MTITLNGAQFSSTSYEWYTPPAVIRASRVTMRGLDLDPASCDEANEVVRAPHYYTKEQNGLLLPWWGKVFLNPPYGREGGSLVAQFIDKLLTEYHEKNIEQAILLVNAATDRTWFVPLWKYPICFPSARLKFRRPKALDDDGKKNQPSQANALIYLGPDRNRFGDHFELFGPIVQKVRMLG